LMPSWAGISKARRGTKLSAGEPTLMPSAAGINQAARGTNFAQRQAWS